jgi:hypothetical protein
MPPLLFAFSYFSGRIFHVLLRAGLRLQSSYLWPPALKIIFLRPGILEHVCNPSTWEEETGGSWVPGQPWDIERHCLQETKKAKTKILFLNP